MAVMTVPAIRAIPPSPKVLFFLGGRDRSAEPAPSNARLLRASNSSVPARTSPECKEKHCFFHASEGDRRGPVGDVRLARAAEEEDIADGS